MYSRINFDRLDALYDGVDYADPTTTFGPDCLSSSRSVPFLHGRCVHRLGSLPVLRRRRYETCLASFVCKGWPCSPSAAAGCGGEDLLGLPSVRLASLLLFFSVLDAAVLDLLEGVAADALRCGWVVFGERKDQIDESDS